MKWLLFDTGEYKRVAVKVIDDRGMEHVPAQTWRWRHADGMPRLYAQVCFGA